MRCWADSSKSRAVTDENDRIYVPYGWKYDGSKRLVVWAHGAGGTYEIGPPERALKESLGVPWLCATLGGTRTWGSDASLDAIDAGWAWAVTNLGVASDKLVLWGGSMGGLTHFLYALDNPSNVAAVAAAIPALDPEYVRLNDPNASDLNTTAIESLYGANEVPADKQAFSRGGDWDNSVPGAIWYSTDDTFTPTASIMTFASASGVTLNSLGAVSHSYSAINTTQVHNFMVDYVHAA